MPTFKMVIVPQNLKETIYMYIYVLEIATETKEIIITKCESSLWELIPCSVEGFYSLMENYPDYLIYELDEKFLRAQGDKHNFMNPN
jgi:hypothetical protein